MATETTYTYARANLKALLDEAVDSREPVIIHRREGEDVALIAVAELRGLIETAHLLRSPKNAERLLRALARAHGRKLDPRRTNCRELGRSHRLTLAQQLGMKSCAEEASKKKQAGLASGLPVCASCT
jgi:antitoxin YefM